MVALFGDCLDLLPNVADESVDMVFADLPYGVTANKWDSVIPFGPLWTELLRVGKRNAAFVFTATQPFATALICSQPKLFRYDLVWEKNKRIGHLNANKMPLRSHECVLVFYRNIPAYTPQKTSGHPATGSNKSVKNVYLQNQGVTRLRKEYVATDKRMPGSVLRVALEHNINLPHPTQKPVALLEWLIRTYTSPGETCLDPTMGSGTTGVACINTDRKFIGMEKDATYFETAQHRLEEAQNAHQTRLRLDGGRPQGSGEGSAHRRRGREDQLALAPCDGPALAMDAP